MSDLRRLEVCALALGLSLGFAAYRLALDPENWLARKVRRYVTDLDQLFEAMLLRPQGARIAFAQALGLVVLLWLALATGAALWLGAALGACALLPKALLSWARRKRIQRVDAELHTFNVSFANALKTTPSIGNALVRVQAVTSGPLSDELALTLNELRLGTTVEQALLNLSARVQSPALDVTLSGVLIGRQVGGPIAAILESTAATFREMQRLSGVLRTKTAESKGQIKILAVAPAAVVVLFEWAQPGYFHPLFESLVGVGIVVFSVFCWVSAVFWAHKILAVEL